MKRSRTTAVTITAVIAALGLVQASGAAQAERRPVAFASATCDAYANQAAAQRAADTRDPDGDGIFCVIYSR